MTRTQRIAFAALCLLSTGCASQQQLADYQNEIRVLREERTQLKKENGLLRMQNESYEVQLAEASMSLTATPDMPDYAELDALGIDYREQGGNFVISIPSSITFGSGKAELTSEGKRALKVVADTLRADYSDGQYWIEGHTDSDPIRKSKWSSNRELSSARAMAVLHYLVESCEIEDANCVVAGHGEYVPIGANDDAAGKARNRRVEIVVHRKPVRTSSPATAVAGDPNRGRRRPREPIGWRGRRRPSRSSCAQKLSLVTCPTLFSAAASCPL